MVQAAAWPAEGEGAQREMGLRMKDPVGQVCTPTETGGLGAGEGRNLLFLKGLSGCLACRVEGA